MTDILEFKVTSPWTGEESVLEYAVDYRRWTCSRCGTGPRCVHAEAVIRTFAVEQIVKVAEKAKWVEGGNTEYAAGAAGRASR